MASRRCRNTNYFSTILSVDSELQNATLAHTGQILIKSPRPNLKQILNLLRKVDSWVQNMKFDSSVTQLDIAKSEGISRSRVSQLLDLRYLPSEIRYRIEHASGSLEFPLNVHQLRKLAKNKKH